MKKIKGWPLALGMLWMLYGGAIAASDLGALLGGGNDSFVIRHLGDLAGDVIRDMTAGDLLDLSGIDRKNPLKAAPAAAQAAAAKDKETE